MYGRDVNLCICCSVQSKALYIYIAKKNNNLILRISLARTHVSHLVAYVHMNR